MKMFKQRFRERDLGWISGSNSGSSATSPPTPSVIAVAIPPVSILTNAHLPTPSGLMTSSPELCDSPLLPVTTPVLPVPPGSPSPLVLERPRKKLSFRDPEVTTSGSTGNGEEVAHLVTLKDQPFCDSMENVDLESEAMKIVRTVGQAFEVCHKLAATSSTSTAATTPQTCRADDVHQDQHRQDEEKEEEEEEEEEDGQEEVGDTFSNADVVSVESHIKSNQEATLNQSESQHPGDCSDVTLPLEAPPPMDSGGQVTSLALQHEVLLLKQQVEQQQQQTQAAIGQVKLLKDQLAAETAARMDAQTRTHQLLIHNKELLDHIQTLVLQMQQLESKVASAGSSAMLQQNAASTLPQLPLTARIMEWLQLQPISRQESGFVESVTIEEDDNPPQRHDVARQSLPSSSKLKTSRRWKFLSRKSSWRSL